jgi:hypothetical protein
MTDRILKVGPPYCELKVGYPEPNRACCRPTIAICKACGAAICEYHSAKCAVCREMICDNDVCAQSHECLPMERSAAA